MNTELSSYLEFKTDDIDDKGYGKRKGKVRKTILYVVCPLCGLNRPIFKTGIWSRNWRKRALSGFDKEKIARAMRFYEEKLASGTGALIRSRAKKYNPSKETRFDIVNLDKEPFISERVDLGRGKGFKEIGITPLAQVTKSENEEGIELLKQVKKQCIKILNAIEKTGI